MIGTQQHAQPGPITRLHTDL